MRSNDDVDYPNLMFHFLPIAIRYDGSAPASDHGYQVHIGPMYSDARGIDQDQEHRPARAPRDAFNYLSTDQDRREWVEAIRVARDILNQPAFDPFNAGETLTRARRRDRRADPGVGRERRRDRAAPLVHRAAWASTTLSVVDPLTMKVHGLEGLRVVDASVMPYVTNGNIYAPVMMVAEKAADLILGNTPLPAGEGRVLPAPGRPDTVDVEVTGEPADLRTGAANSPTSWWSRDLAPEPSRSTATCSGPRSSGSTAARPASCSSSARGSCSSPAAPPTDDKPTVTFEAPADPDRVSHSMTFRVPDCRHAHEVLSARGAVFLAPLGRIRLGDPRLLPRPRRPPAGDQRGEGRLSRSASVSRREPRCDRRRPAAAARPPRARCPTYWLGTSRSCRYTIDSTTAIIGKIALAASTIER